MSAPKIKIFVVVILELIFAMLAAKSWDRAAFGSQSLRFNLNGLHPNLYATGKMPYDSSVTSKTVVRIVNLVLT